ncbi:hypothetical protein J0X23_05940 [Lactiplantibacillus plantarum]|uniref:hypothetical protein n=1 Tax=Lactiplantibacillus plantarum TaxID=1590 RepID=UPI001A93526C|nr:hypothetical protein [Lactiplantibacillus plantarum]QSW67979.1 hypothetical protein J0X23_05940 [Lactiplantibacillus plantarum]
MAESNATQVILTDDGIKIIKAQNTADNAASQAENANSATLIAQSTATAAKSAADSTYDYANSEMAVNSMATAKAQSTADNAFSQAQVVGSQASAEIAVQSNATAKAQSTADNAFSQAQAVGSQTSAEINNNSTATAKAQSTADNAFSQATTAIDNNQATNKVVTDLKDGSTMTIAELQNGLAAKVANSDYASYKDQTASQIGEMVTDGTFSAYSQATAALISDKVATKDFSAYQATTAKLIDSKVSSSDFSTYKTQTATAIDDKVSNSEYASDKTQTASEISDRVSNSAFSTYQTQTASQFAQKVDNGTFSAYQTTTAGLIAKKVATSDFSAYQATTAKSISSKVDNGDFTTYKTQTATAINDKVSSSEYASDQKQTASQIGQMVSNSAFSTYKDQTASQIGEMVTNGAFSAYQQTTAGLIAQKVAASDFSAYQATTAKSISSKVESSDFNTYKTQTATAISSKVSSTDFNNLKISNRNLALGTAKPFKMTGTNSTNNYDYMYHLSRTIAKGTTITVAYDITSTNSTGTYLVQFTGGSWGYISGILPLTSGTQHHSYTLVTNSDYSDRIQLRLDNATGTVTMSNFIISESSKEVSWTPAPEDQATQSQITQLSNDINLRVTKDGLIDEINLQAGNTLISSSGQLTLSGKNIYFDTNNPVIIPSANITGTLNGKTINAGTQLNQYGNTSYPLTLSPDGSVTSTSFESIANETAALRTVIKDGTVKTNLRGMTPFSSGMYSAADVSLGAGQLVLLEGYSTAQDPNFDATGLKTTGYAILDASTGLSLHGVTQAINFSGTDQDQTTGIMMNSYGNIIGYPNATWWRIVSNAGSNVANFGIDKAGSNVIQFNRELDIGNFQINTGHTFTSADNQAIHFAMGKGGAADIYAGAVHYTSLVKSSLLSVKKDVQKADTAYWAQLVNSIDLATYQYKSDDNTSHIRLSSIVDDVNDTKQWRLPDVFIARDENGKLNGVDDSVLLNATLATVQEQQKQISALNGHLLKLEAKLNG